MKKRLSILVASTIAFAPAPLLADSGVGFGDDVRSASGKELPPYLQCVPFARNVSGIEIYGDAYTWWDQADGRFERGNRPKVGAVMAFQPHQSMQLGHVAAVSKIIDKRTVLLRHANWSPINGRRGQVENDVRAVDVSPRNDWSEVRVWYNPLQALGKTAWPVHGFIYSKQTNSPAMKNRFANSIPVTKPVSSNPTRQFASAFAGVGKTSQRNSQSQRAASSPKPASPKGGSDFASHFAKYGN